MKGRKMYEKKKKEGHPEDDVWFWWKKRKSLKREERRLGLFGVMIWGFGKAGGGEGHKHVIFPLLENASWDLEGLFVSFFSLFKITFV